jgi:hypothetical protein
MINIYEEIVVSFFFKHIFLLDIKVKNKKNSNDYNFISFYSLAKNIT